MPVVSLTKIPVYAWIPPAYDAEYKIEIVGDDTTDITELILGGEIIDGATDTIGSFNFIVDNSDESRTNKWVGNEILNFYCDYATSATSLRFKGRIEKVSYVNETIRITGRSKGAELLDLTATYSTTDTTSNILTYLIETYTTFTTTNISIDPTNVTVNWYQKPIFECIQELCSASGYDFYIDCNDDAHYFLSGSVDNADEAVVHDSNLFEVGDFAYDLSQIKNRVIVYGANIGNLPLIATSEDTTSQSSYGIKEAILNDTNVTTVSQAQEKANYELAKSKDPPLIGDVSCKGLATIQPGERVRISAPYSNLNPNYYKILKYVHTFDGFHETTLTIEKEPKAFYHVMKDRISNEQKLTDQPNPNQMRYSWNFDFNIDSGTHSTTQITGGVLKSTSSSGTWISDTNPMDSNVLYCEMRADGETIPGTNFYVSIDGGINYQSVTLNTAKTLSPPGTNLKIKVVINSADTQIDSLCLLYRFT